MIVTYQVENFAKTNYIAKKLKLCLYLASCSDQDIFISGAYRTMYMKANSESLQQNVIEEALKRISFHDNQKFFNLQCLSAYYKIVTNQVSQFMQLGKSR